MKFFGKRLILLLILASLAITTVSLFCLWSWQKKNLLLLEKDYQEQMEKNLHEQALEHASSIDIFLHKIESVVKTTGAFAKKQALSPSSSSRKNFFHDPEFRPAPDNLEYSSKHRQHVAFYHSAFKVAPEGYHDTKEYLEAPDALSYGDWSEEVEKTIQWSKDLDLIFAPMYATMPETLWVYMGFESGVHRTYPYHGPLEKEYDPRKRPWHLVAQDSPAQEVVFTTPFIDATTGKVIISAVYKIENEGRRIGVVGVDILLEKIQDEVLAIDAGDAGRAFLINEENFVIAHPEHTLPNAIWQETDLQVSIQKYETEDNSFRELLKKSVNHKGVQGKVYYSNKEKLVSFVPLAYGGITLGLVTNYPHVKLQARVPFLRLRNIILVGILAAIMAVVVFLVFPWHQENQQNLDKKRLVL